MARTKQALTPRQKTALDAVRSATQLLAATEVERDRRIREARAERVTVDAMAEAAGVVSSTIYAILERAEGAEATGS